MSSSRLLSLEVIDPISGPGANIKDTIVIPNYNKKQPRVKVLGLNSKRKIAIKRRNESIKKRKESIKRRKESINSLEREIIVVSSDSDSEKTEIDIENEKSEGLQERYKIDNFPIITVEKNNYLNKRDIFLNNTNGSNYITCGNILKSVNTDKRLIEKFQHLINTNRERWVLTNQMCVDATYRSIRCNIEGKTPIFYTLIFSKYLYKFIWLKISNKFISQKIQHYLIRKYYQDNAIHVLSSLKMKKYNN